MNAIALRVRPPEAADYEGWRELYQRYADFYHVDQPAESAQRVWSWVHDPDHEVEALLAEDDDGRVVGLAHYRTFARPLSATKGGRLDDLFVDTPPAAAAARLTRSSRS